MKNPWYTQPFILITAVIAVLLIGLLIFLPNSGTGDTNQTGTPKIAIQNETYSWGNIPINEGNVEYEFTIQNTGDAPLVIRDIETSCMCTTAQLIVGSDESRMFGMKHVGDLPVFWTGKIPAGGEGKIRVVFDPLFHGPNGTGPITRLVKFRTNDPKTPTIELKLTGNVTP